MTLSLAPLADISIVIPVAPGEECWVSLLQDLRILPAQSEILLVSPSAEPKHLLAAATEKLLAEVRWIQSASGRAEQMNVGAQKARHPWLWFLHADTKVPRPAIAKMAQALQGDPRDLLYFKLQFLADGPRVVHLNSFLANIRSRCLGMPFGDQGFFMHREVFEKVGGFPEHLPYGEDHVFAWEAKRKHIHLRCLDAALFTSARKYEQGGWGHVTRQHIYLTARQALGESVKTLKSRILD